MTDQEPRVPPRNAVLLRSLLPSLVILVGVFFFISSACFSDGDNNSGYGYNPCPVAQETAAPANSFARILEPAIDQVFSGPVVDGLVQVPVSLRAGVVLIASVNTCQRDTGHFMLIIERIAGEGCVDPSTLQVVPLYNGETAAPLQLSPGTYALKATVYNGNDAPFEPEISDTVHFVVDGPPPMFDGGICP